MIQELLEGGDLYQALDQPERSKTLRWSQRSAADIQTSSPIPAAMLSHLTFGHTGLFMHRLLVTMA